MNSRLPKGHQDLGGLTTTKIMCTISVQKAILLVLAKRGRPGTGSS